MGYTKQFLIDAFLWRYSSILLTHDIPRLDAFVSMIENFYDEVGKDKFRVYASLDSDAIQKFRLATGC